MNANVKYKRSATDREHYRLYIVVPRFHPFERWGESSLLPAGTRTAMCLNKVRYFLRSDLSI